MEKIAIDPGQITDSLYFRNLQDDLPFWAQISSPKICYACLLKPCTYFLPCSHALCEDCQVIFLRLEIEYEETEISRRCPFCTIAFHQWERVTPLSDQSFPKKGIIYKYYDLALTVLEVGLQIKEWNSDKWVRILVSFAKIALKRPDTWLNLVGGWGVTWRNLVQLAGRQCPRQRDALERSLQKAFGMNILPSTASGKATGVENMAWALIAKLFSFELKRTTRTRDNKIQCVGTIHCHSSFESLIVSMTKLLDSQVNFHIHDSYFAYRSPCTVAISLPRLDHSLDIQLTSGSLSASIDGFPTSAHEILKNQAVYSTKTCKAQLRFKRKFEISETRKPWPKRKKLENDTSPID